MSLSTTSPTWCYRFTSIPGYSVHMDHDLHSARLIFRISIRKVLFQQTKCASFLLSYLRLLLCKHTLISMLLLHQVIILSIVLLRIVIDCSVPPSSSSIPRIARLSLWQTATFLSLLLPLKLHKVLLRSLLAFVI